MIRHPYTTGGLVEDRFEGKNCEEVIFQAMHHQFVASALATKICHEIVPDSKVGCMLTKLTYYPYTCKPEDVLALRNKRCVLRMPIVIRRYLVNIHLFIVLF